MAVQATRRMSYLFPGLLTAVQPHST